MKRLLWVSLRTLPVFVMIGIMAILFGNSKDLDEGLKLSLSALLGAMASYLFVQYAEFLKAITQLENRHSGALHTLDLILNDLLDWLSNVKSGLNSHTEILERDLNGNTVTHDSSSSRSPVLIRLEIIDAVNNITLKNKLRHLNIDLERVETDLNSMRSSHRFAVDTTISDNMEYEVYKTVFLPSHLRKIDNLNKIIEQLVVDTKDSLSIVRVLKNERRGMSNTIRRFLIEQKEPADFKNLTKHQLQILEDQIKDVRSNSRDVFRDIQQKG